MQSVDNACRGPGVRVSEDGFEAPGVKTVCQNQVNEDAGPPPLDQAMTGVAPQSQAEALSRGGPF